MSNFWDNKYSAVEFVYGKNPNAFFKSVIDPLTPGKILVPGAGEGRDAVYAATLGWNVFAFDQSAVGKQKALTLAREKHVRIHYEVLDALDFDFTKDTFDAIALIYFHLPPNVRAQFYSRMKNSLTHNGIIILEAFNPKQINNSSGGPSDKSMMMTSDLLKKEFAYLQILDCGEHQIDLNEGTGHSGKADVVRFVGKNIEH